MNLYDWIKIRKKRIFDEIDIFLPKGYEREMKMFRVDEYDNQVIENRFKEFLDEIHKEGRKVARSPLLQKKPINEIYDMQLFKKQLKSFEDGLMLSSRRN